MSAKPRSLLAALALLASLVVFNVHAQLAPPIRVLPLGDSITYGSGAAGGYRAPLYQLLTNAGYNVDFVGTQTGNGIASLPDSDHEGHSGWRIDQIDSIILGVFDAVDDPDIILLLIGTNDYGQGYDTPNATNRFEALIARMATNRPYAKIIVANLLVRGEPYNTQIQTTFNPFVQSICDRQRALGREVYFDDLRSAVPLADMPDNLHPGALGYAKMATNWFGVITNHFSPLGSTNVPAAVRALGQPGWSNITVTFSKPVADSAADLSNYSIPGLSILAATLDPGKRVVTLKTSRQTPGASYSVSVSGVKDRTAAQLTIAPATLSFLGAPLRGVYNNVPEAANFTLVYSLDIPNSATYGTPAYTVVNRTNIGAFTRVGYYLELQSQNTPLKYIWVSMDPFTTDLGQAGVPTVSTFQQPITNMNVLSSVEGIVNGTGLSGGNMEFFPSNYTTNNVLNVPNASSNTYDWGDQTQSGGYGSMQLHNNAASQVLFAFNHWGSSGGVIDLGIGSQPGGNPDWTFANNAPAYTIKTLQVLALPAADNIGPAPVRVVGSNDYTTVRITFTEPLSDEATNTDFYDIQGLTVLGAELDAVTRCVVTLTTSPQQPLAKYTLACAGITDRFGNTGDFVSIQFISSANNGVYANVPEAKDYSLVYSLDIPTTAMFHATNIPYSVDLHNYVSNYSRIGYYLELQPIGGPIQFVWTTMDPFSTDPGRIGVPATGSSPIQQYLTNLSVISSVQGVTWVTNSSGGNIEFWPGNYSAANGAAIPNASASTLDWGDTVSAGNGHGSMQIHNYAASEVVFAFNNWGGTSTTGDVDLGIGYNTANANPDWTFMRNGATYSVRTLQVFVLPTNAVPPAIVNATETQPGWTNLVLTFTKTLDDDATNVSHYALNGGVTVVSATLDPTTKAFVTLQTTLQQPRTAYTVTVNGLKDRTTAQLGIAPNSTAQFVTASLPAVDAYTAVPEAANWTVLYSIDIPTASSYNTTGVLYRADNRLGVTDFSRIAYLLELATPGSPTNYVWVSMNPFSKNVTKLGIPTTANMAYFQGPVSNLTVYSSVPGIVSGTNLSGNIELWPWDYTAANALSVPNASIGAFDFGDQASLYSGGYGSFQIHNSAARQTLLAFNNFGGTGGGDICLGIGNNTSTSASDWTHVKNAATYSHRRLTVFVLPTADTTAPTVINANYSPELKNIIVHFSEPVADNAALAANYSLNIGAIASATLSNNLRDVVLSVPSFALSNSYTLTISGVRDRSANANLMAPTNVVVTAPLLPPQILANVAESSAFKLVYKLDLPVVNAGLNFTGTVYDVDNRIYTGPFSRVAYYLELATNGGPTNWVYVSMDPFTSDVNKIGVPDLPSGAVFQQKVTNMNVYSSQADIVTGAGITTGNIEFWGLSYSQGTNVLIPTGASGAYDWNDVTNTAYFGSDGYGSMQIHNHGAYSTGQVLFAYNNWGKTSGALIDLGIGNRPGNANADWTTAANGTNYIVKNLYVLVLPALDTTSPTIVRAVPASTRTNVVVTFSEAVSEGSASATNFTLDGGVTVTAATLRSNSRDVILTTTAQTPGTLYTLTVNNVTDRSTNANVIAPNSTTTFTAPAVAPVFNRVAEAANYQLVHYLALPSTAPNYNVNGINYNIDLRNSITQPFNRIAYYLELAPTVGGTTNWVYVSADAFTPLVSRVGVPVMGTGAGFQQKLGNMTVQSGVPGIVTGSSIVTGNIEFWPFNYQVNSNNIITNGSNTTYDWNDSYNTGGQYGSMQLHNHGAGSTGQVLFAFSKWGGGQSGNVDLGIGNSGATNPDWTTHGGASTNAVRNLYVLVRMTNAVTPVPAAFAPLLVLQPTSRLVQAGNPLALAALAGGTDACAYQWRLNGNILPGETGSVLTRGSASAGDAGAYDVIVSNNGGSVTSLVAVVTVNQAPVGAFHTLVTTQNQPVNVNVAKLLSRDSDPDNDAIAISGVTGTSTNGGSVALGATAITYTPVSGFVGTDAFTYALSDTRGGSTPVPVLVFVLSPNASTLNMVTTPQLTSSNTFNVKLAGIPGYEYVVQAANSVTGVWQTVTTVIAPTNGVFEVNEPVTPPIPPQRFYRTQPAPE